MTIAEVSKKFDLSQDTLRYYERVGVFPPVPRNKSGLRDYDEESCRWIQLAKCLRAAGLPIEALIEYATLYQQGDSTLNARKELLIEQRQLLLDKIDTLQTALNRLDEKIQRYDTVLIPDAKKGL